eukprot:c18153_g2_i3 orf=49-411(-)
MLTSLRGYGSYISCPSLSLHFGCLVMEHIFGVQACPLIFDAVMDYNNCSKLLASCTWSWKNHSFQPIFDAVVMEHIFCVQGCPLIVDGVMDYNVNVQKCEHRAPGLVFFSNQSIEEQRIM